MAILYFVVGVFGKLRGLWCKVRFRAWMVTKYSNEINSATGLEHPEKRNLHQSRQ
jgi:hypothetical protein